MTLHPATAVTPKTSNSLKFRLLSFHTRLAEDGSVRVTAIRLAKDGFLYDEETGHVICQECNLQLKDFCNYVDTYVLHQLYSPNCPFLTHGRERHQTMYTSYYPSSLSSESKNLSKHVTMLPTRLSELSDETSGAASVDAAIDGDVAKRYKYLVDQRVKICTALLPTSSSNQTDLRFEKSRCATFKHIPRSDLGRCLAAKGMSYLYKERLLQCFFCNFTFQLTSEEDWDLNTITEDHKTAFPQCKTLTGQRSSNVPDVLNDSCWTDKLRKKNRENHDTLQHLGIHRKLTENPELAVVERRKTTFLTYPHSGGKLDTERLCNAGYFYEGVGTAVTCFSCGLISGDWGSNEDPWKRHARSSTSCQFITDQKGRDFVTATLEELGEYKNPKEENKINNVTPRMLRPRWDSGPVQMALSMGMNRESVRTVISKRIKQGKPDFRYVAEIYKALNDLAVPEQELSTQPEFKLPIVVQLPSDPVREDLQSSEQSESAVEETEEVRVTSDSAVTSIMDTTESTSAATSSTVTEDLTRNVGEAKTWTSKLTCSVCLSNAIGIIFLPCAHLVCCVDCAAAVLHCPICRQAIRGTIRADFKHLG